MGRLCRLQPHSTVLPGLLDDTRLKPQPRPRSPISSEQPKKYPRASQSHSQLLVPIQGSSMSSPDPTRQDEGSSFLRKPQKMMSSRTEAWVATKMPATSVGNELRAVVAKYPRTTVGVHCQKVTTRGKLKSRVLTVSSDGFCVYCTHQPIKNSVFSMASKLPIPFITRKGIRGFTSKEALRDTYVRYMDIADINYVQVGVVATQRLEYAKMGRYASQIVVIGHHGNRTLNLLIPNKTERVQMVNCILRLRRVYHESKKWVGNEGLLLRYLWYDVDADRNGQIGPSEFQKILLRMNFYLPKPLQAFEKQCKKLGVKPKQGLTYPQVVDLLESLKVEKKSSIAQILWQESFGSAPTVSAVEFLAKFVQTRQCQPKATIQEVQKILDFLHRMEGRKPNDGADLDPYLFQVYLFDILNSAYDTTVLDASPQLDQPLSAYWINTSHNTYLSGDQLQSASSVEYYLKALRRGCKCLELDCWDGDKAPVVFHGHTLTSKILFKDIIQAVKVYMDFHPYTYPIILSLENHCSESFQKEMADIMTSILGKYLYVPSADVKETALPSPESLKGMIVIKGKRPPAPEGEEDPDDDPYAEDASSSAPSSSKGKQSHKKIVPELAKLTLFHGTKYKDFKDSIQGPCSHMHSIGESKITKILNKSSANAKLWKEYNVHHMTRTYPAGTRVDSSNYNPLLAWAVGSQMVALNFQTADAPLILNDGRFRANRGCGYVAKPASLMGSVGGTKTPQPKPADAVAKALPEPDALDVVMEGFESIVCGVDERQTTQARSFSPTHDTNVPVVASPSKDASVATVEHSPSEMLSIRVLAGSCLPKPKGATKGEFIDPKITITVHDVEVEPDGKTTYVTSSHSTVPVNDNGFCPVWNEKKGKSFVINTPDVAMLHLALRESDVVLDEKVADAAIPIAALKPGIRSVQLFDPNSNTRTGHFGFASILLEITVKNSTAASI